MRNTVENKTKDKTTQCFRNVDPQEISSYLPKFFLILDLSVIGKGGESYGM